MRRITFPVFVALLLMVASMVPAASKGRTAKASYDFDLTKPGATAWYGDDYGVFFGDAVTFPTAKGQRGIMLSVMDDSADQVSAAVWQEGQPAQVFCESLDHFPIKGGSPVFVQVIVDVTPTTGNGCASPTLPTTGTVTAMFH